jgi:hypothetical protein
MAIVNPKERTSTTQMLLKHFDGIRLSISRNQVSALTSSPPPTIAAAKAPPPAPRDESAQRPLCVTDSSSLHAVDPMP